MDAEPQFPALLPPSVTATVTASAPATAPAPSPASTVLAWVAALAYLPVLYVALLNLAGANAALRLLLPAVLLALPAGLLVRRPLPALALMLAGSFAVTVTLPSPGPGYSQALLIDLAVGFVAATRARRTSLVAALAALAVQGAALSYYTHGNDAFTASVALITLAIVTAWTAGHSIRQRRDHARALRSQAAAQAVLAERLRIARELHDIVAHSIGIIAIQAGVGSRVIDTQPAEARNALRAIEATSRETLAGLRRMLGALRRAEPDLTEPDLTGPDPAGPGLLRGAEPDLTGPDPGAADPASDTGRPGSMPGLADVDRLAASTRNAGVRVEVRWRGRRRALPADIDLSAFRIVQEALTNVVRHAGTGECRVTVDYREEELAIEVADDGPGRGPAGTARGPAGAGAGASGPGYGMLGMKERVGLLHGEFTAGPRPEGGFRVAVRLPVPAGVR